MNEFIRESLLMRSITTETEMKIKIKTTTGSNYLLSTNLVVPNLFSIDDDRTLSFFHSQSWWEKVKMKKRYTQKKCTLKNSKIIGWIRQNGEKKWLRLTIKNYHGCCRWWSKQDCNPVLIWWPKHIKKEEKKRERWIMSVSRVSQVPYIHITGQTMGTMIQWLIHSFWIA